MATTKKAAAAAEKETTKAVKAAEKETVKAEKAPAKKAPAKKAAPKKTAPKKPAEAEAKVEAKVETKETKVNFFVEFGGVQVPVEEVVNNIKASIGKDAAEIAVYLKPEESKAYYVADGEAGDIDVFFC